MFFYIEAEACFWLKSLRISSRTSGDELSEPMVTLQNTKFSIEDEKPPAFILFALLSPRRINDLNMDYRKGNSRF